MRERAGLRRDPSTSPSQPTASTLAQSPNRALAHSHNRPRPSRPRPRPSPARPPAKGSARVMTQDARDERENERGPWRSLYKPFEKECFSVLSRSREKWPAAGTGLPTRHSGRAWHTGTLDRIRRISPRTGPRRNLTPSANFLETFVGSHGVQSLPPQGQSPDIPNSSQNCIAASPCKSGMQF